MMETAHKNEIYKACEVEFKRTTNVLNIPLFFIWHLVNPNFFKFCFNNDIFLIRDLVVLNSDAFYKAYSSYGNRKKDQMDNDFLVIIWFLGIFDLKFIGAKKTYYKSTAKKMAHYTRKIDEVYPVKRKIRISIKEKRSFL
jgi:hypothetical protein